MARFFGVFSHFLSERPTRVERHAGRLELPATLVGRADEVIE